MSVRAGLLLALTVLAACGPATPVAPPPPQLPAPAQAFLNAFAAAEANVERELRVTAQECVTAGRLYTCTLKPLAPRPAASQDMRLTLTLDGAIVTATTVEATPADAATHFAALSAIATAQGEPLNTRATSDAFKRDLGFAGTPKPGRSAVSHRTYGDFSCALDEREIYVCTITPLVATGDLPPPAGAMVRATR